LEVPATGGAVALGDLLPTGQETFYTRFGNLFAYLCLGLSGLFLIGAFVKKS